MSSRSEWLEPLIRGYKPLLVQDGRLYAASLDHLWISENHGVSFKRWAKYPTRNALERTSHLYARVARAGMHGLAFFPNGDAVGIVRKAILFKEKGQLEFRVAFEIPRGSRPLNIAFDPENQRMFWGEYFANRQRDAVRIYGSETGRDWEVVYTFKPGTIRHVHRIIYDRFRSGLWVLTGDEDHESHLWFTNDNFRTLTSVIGHSQRTRAVSVVPLADGLMVPTDTPREQNYIQFLDMSTQKLSVVHPIAGSAFHTYADNDLMLVSSVVEPSAVNRTDSVELYASRDGQYWYMCLSLKQDLFAQCSYRLFQYPELFIADGKDHGDYVYLFARGVRPYGGYGLRLHKSSVIQQCNAQA